VAVTIPTRNRPAQLRRCLAALGRARQELRFRAWVGDSSDPDRRAALEEVCAEHDWVRLRFHDGRNVAAARNFCARIADAELIVNVDDDIQVEPDAIRLLVARYEAEGGPRVVGGSVAWGDWWSRPLRVRPFGFARRVEPGEVPDFLNGALFLYPRAFALTWPWNERIRVADDIFMGAVWRAAGVRLLWEPEARARHDPERVAYGPEDQDSTIYANLFLSLIAVPDWRRAAAFEVLGFLSALRSFGRRPESLRALLCAWARGHRALLRDRRYLAELVRRPAPVAVSGPSTTSRYAASTRATNAERP
jgi:glycosyltransferase involved in cell wall biosynthesis